MKDMIFSLASTRYYKFRARYLHGTSVVSSIGLILCLIFKRFLTSFPVQRIPQLWRCEIFEIVFSWVANSRYLQRQFAKTRILPYLYQFLITMYEDQDPHYENCMDYFLLLIIHAWNKPSVLSPFFEVNVPKPLGVIISIIFFLLYSFFFKLTGHKIILHLLKKHEFDFFQSPPAGEKLKGLVNTLCELSCSMKRQEVETAVRSISFRRDLLMVESFLFLVLKTYTLLVRRFNTSYRIVKSRNSSTATVKFFLIEKNFIRRVY